MDATERKKFLVSKLREAGSSGNKIHVIARGLKWVVINESSHRALGVYRSKQQAIRKAKSLLDSGSTAAVIYHNRDGSVSRRRNTNDLQIHYAEAG